MHQWMYLNEDVPKELDVLRNVPQPRQHVTHSRILGVGRTSQFFERLDRFECLRLETSRPSVPEHRRARRIDGHGCNVELPPGTAIVGPIERSIQNRRRVAFGARDASIGRIDP